VCSSKLVTGTERSNQRPNLGTRYFGEVCTVSERLIFEVDRDQTL
jgi:hypothetical protein